MRKETLIELIVEVFDCRNKYDTDGCQRSLRKMKDVGEILGCRLGVPRSSALAFSIIFVEASYGRLLTRETVVKFLPPDTTLVERLECIWILLEKSLVECYQDNNTPIRTFYIVSDVANAIILNRVPVDTGNNKKEVQIEERRVKVTGSSESTGDYLLLLDQSSVGFILKKSSGKGFDVYWLGEYLMDGDDLDSIVDSLNEMLREGKLKPSIN